jgi:WD40 repeat protein
MLMAKIRVTAATLLMVGVLAVGAGVLARQGTGERNPREGRQFESAGAAVKPSATDSLDDPLPSGARLRLGISRFRPPSIVVDLALSPDETTIVTVGKELVAWDAATGKERWRADPWAAGLRLPGASYGLRAVAFSADSSRFYTPGRLHLPNEIVVWETATGRHEVLTIATPNRIGEMEAATRSVDITPDGWKLAAGSGHGLVVCDLHGKVLYEIANAHGPFKLDNKDRLAFSGHSSLGRFSPDGSILAVVTSDRPEDIRLYEAETGRELRKIALAARLVRLAFSPKSFW